MDVRKPGGSFASGLLAKKHEEKYFPVQKNSETTENQATNAGKFYRSTFSTPTKTSCGTQSQSQTPASKLGYLSASRHNTQHPNGKASEDAVNNRTPLRLLDVSNKNGSLFSPSPLEPLRSPAFIRKPRRVLIMKAELLPSPRRVPVKQKSSEPMNAMRQSPFSTPKKPPCATPISSKTLFANCPKDDDHHNDVLQRRENMFGFLGKVLACTPQRTPISSTKRVGHGHIATFQKHNLIEHRDACVKSNVLPKRSFAFTYQQSPSCTNISNTMDASTLAKDAEVYDGIAKERYVTDWRDDDMKVDRLAHLRRVLASSPLLSMPARRVPIKKKPKQQREEVASQHNKKNPAKSVEANRTNQENLDGFDTRKESEDKAKQLREGYGVDVITVGESKESDASEEGLDQAKTLCDDGIHAICIGDLKRHDAREGTDEGKQDCGNGVGDLSVGELNQHDTREDGTEQAKQCGLGKQGAGEEATHKAKHKLGNDVGDKRSVGADLKKHNDRAADLNASKRLKQKCTTKDTGCSSSKTSDNKKQRKKLSSLSKTLMLSPNGEAMRREKTKEKNILL